MGLYLPTGSTLSTLYEHGERVEICSATVNHEQTLLVFSVVDNTAGYATYVAEIQPKGRVFNLNMDAAGYQKAQFTQQVFTTLSQSQSKVAYTTSRLLVAVLNKSIDLYQFKLQIVEDGAILMNKPKGVSIIGNFDWYQWLPKKQWLCYASFHTTELDPNPLQERGSFVFSCLSFEKGSGQAVITVSLPLPYPSGHYTAHATLFPSPFAHVAPVRELNLQVLHRCDGLWCVGLQHNGAVDRHDDDNNDIAPSPDPGTTQTHVLDYSIYLLHSGQLLYGQVPLSSTHVPPPPGSRLHFMLLGGFVAVYVPGLLLHLLNVGPNAMPIHHLALDGTLSPTPPPPPAGCESFGIRGPFAPAVSNLNIGGDSLLLECGPQTLHQCHLDLDALHELFRSTSDGDLRVSLLHLAIVNFRHHSLARSMVEHLCRHPTPVNMHTFAEFVVSSAYSNVVIDCPRYVTRQLPSTISPAHTEFAYRDPRGRVHAQLTVSGIRLFQKQLIVQSDRRWTSMSADALLKYELSDDPFEQVCLNVTIGQAGIKQLSIREEVSRLNPSVLAAVASKVKPKRVVLDMRSVPFLRSDEDYRFQTIEHMQRVKQAMYQAIADPVQAKKDVRHVVKIYCSEMEKRSQELLAIAWNSIGMNNENNPLLDSIHRSATAKEKHLFEVLEAYRLAHMELGIPTPNGFHTLFTCVGYLCLDPDKFLQCMKVQRMFTLTRRFVQRLAQHGNLRQESAAYEVMCALEEPLHQYAFHLWANRLVEQSDEV